MLPVVLGVVSAVCETFGLPNRYDPLKELIFEYADGFCESFGNGTHLVPLKGGYWLSTGVDLNIVREVFIAASVMEIIAFLHFNGHRFNRPAELLFIAIGPRYNFPEVLTGQLISVKLNLLFGTDLIDTLRAIRFCMDIKGIRVLFYPEGDGITFMIPTCIFSIPQKEVSLRRFIALAGMRPFFKQCIPKSKVSFLYEFLNQWTGI